MATAPDLSAIIALHRQVDEAIADRTAQSDLRLLCGRGCADCCTDGLTVFEIEAARIIAHQSRLLAEGVPHPPGACAFLDPAGGCRVYPDRPYVCRTQGLPLRWIDDPPDGEPVERRDICPLNDPGPPLVGLPARACWTLGPVEAALQALQLARTEGQLPRVALRSLFAHPS